MDSKVSDKAVWKGPTREHKGEKLKYFIPFGLI